MCDRERGRRKTAGREQVTLLAGRNQLLTQLGFDLLEPAAVTKPQQHTHRHQRAPNRHYNTGNGAGSEGGAGLGHTGLANPGVRPRAGLVTLPARQQQEPRLAPRAHVEIGGAVRAAAIEAGCQMIIRPRRMIKTVQIQLNTRHSRMQAPLTSWKAVLLHSLHALTETLQARQVVCWQAGQSAVSRASQ